MKTVIYQSCCIFSSFLLLAIISCTTTAAAEKQQDIPAAEAQSGAEKPEAAAAIIAETPNRTAHKKEPEKPAAPDTAGKTVQQESLPTEHVSAPSAAPAISTQLQNEAATEPVPAVQPEPVQQPSGTSAQPPSGTAPAAEEKKEQNRQSTALSSVDDRLPLPIPAEQKPEPPLSSPTDWMTAEVTAAVEPEPKAMQTYEETLAELIGEFEDQGGTHHYEPPPSFSDEMQEMFSRHIFSVALSKEPETERKVTVSRSAALEEKQRLEIVYPGHGWVYIGEQTSQQGLRYEQRKLQDNTSIFTFIAEQSGNYVLHFSYFDVFTNDFITDAVAIFVSAAKSSASKTPVRAPDYKSKLPGDEAVPDMSDRAAEYKTDSKSPPAPQPTEKAASGTVSETMQIRSAPANTESTTLTAPVLTDSALSGGDKPLTPDALLQKARTAVNSADAVSAIESLELFFAAATKNLDEGWFLRGRAYELNGPTRNIRLALDSYRMLTAAFPHSKYWAAADARIRYITNFYINIQ